MPLADMFWGDRYGKIEDPFGHDWSIATPLRELSETEMREAMQKPRVEGLILASGQVTTHNQETRTTSCSRHSASLPSVCLSPSALFALAATRPHSFETARTAQIAASPERLFALINDLRQMNTWNPYALRETMGTTRYSGPASGKGAVFEFAGPKSGTGSIEIVDFRRRGTS